MDSRTVFLLALLIVVLCYQQWRLFRYRARLARREELFRIVAENAADMIALVDVKGRRLYNSPAYQKVLGYSADELAKTSAFEQIHPDDRLRVLEASREARRTGVGQTVEYRIRHKDGRWRTLESTASTIRNAKGDVEKMVIVNRDITERKQAEEQLTQNLFRDALTGLANRQLFLERLHHVFARARRDPGFHFGVLLLDLDDFKSLNNSLGAASGDQLLLETGRRIAASLRADDTVARPDAPALAASSLLSRTGGDEFTVLLEGASDPSDAMRAAKRIQGSLAAPFEVGGRQVLLSASIGIALDSGAAERADYLLQDADVAMRRARALGGARCEVFDETMHARAEGRLGLETALRAALDHRQFRLFYQPIVHLDSRQIAGFEALLRWQHPEHGLVSPDEFLEVAEDTGLILTLSRWVLRQVCAQIQNWQARTPGLPPIRVTVNGSPRQFAHPEFVPDLRAAMHEAGLSPSVLQFEIPEAAAVGNLQLACDVFSQLKRLGVRISLGDFGAGVSSLNWLRRWPLDELKIDMSLIRSMASERSSREVIELIVHLADTLGLQAVAEGVESELQVDRLLKLGCRLAQGYLFSRPLDPDHAEAFLLKHLARNVRPLSAK